MEVLVGAFGTVMQLPLPEFPTSSFAPVKAAFRHQSPGEVGVNDLPVARLPTTCRVSGAALVPVMVTEPGASQDDPPIVTTGLVDWPRAMAGGSNATFVLVDWLMLWQPFAPW